MLVLKTITKILDTKNTKNIDSILKIIIQLLILLIHSDNYDYTNCFVWASAQATSNHNFPKFPGLKYSSKIQWDMESDYPGCMCTRLKQNK